MDNYSQKHSYDMVNVYSGDTITHQVPSEEARQLKAAGTHYFFNHGKDLRIVPTFSPPHESTNFEQLQTKLSKFIGWNIPHGRMRASALNEGRAGQFTIGYPIPYAFKGHLGPMRVSDVNS